MYNTALLKPKMMLWLASAMALLLAACATMSGVQPPSVQLAGLRVVEMKGFETAFEADLRVLNPNRAALSIQGIACDLALNDRHLANGVAGPQKEIPAYGSEIVTVTIYASMLDLLGAAHRLVQGTQKDRPDEKWTYAVKGQLDMGGGAWSGRIPFDAKGEIDMKEILNSTGTQ
jgi:LEA14-like dessication related protein